MFNKAKVKSVDCPIQNIGMPSAYMKTDPERTAGDRSLVNRVKMVWPSTDPCGIPAVTGRGILSYATFCCAGKWNLHLDLKYKTKIAWYELGFLKILSWLTHLNCSEQAFDWTVTNNVKTLRAVIFDKTTFDEHKLLKKKCSRGLLEQCWIFFLNCMHFANPATDIGTEKTDNKINCPRAKQPRYGSPWSKRKSSEQLIK